MKKPYIFIFLIVVLLYLIYQVISYKYNEYKIYRYTENINQVYSIYEQKIEQAKEIIEHKKTKAYINQALKSQQGMKSPGETVVFLIEEERYNAFTQDISTSDIQNILPQSFLDERSLIQSMSIPQRWNYFLFGRDTR